MLGQQSAAREGRYYVVRVVAAIVFFGYCLSAGRVARVLLAQPSLNESARTSATSICVLSLVMICACVVWCIARDRDVSYLALIGLCLFWMVPLAFTFVF